MTCDDFRGIAISSILSKVFEHCIIDMFNNFLSTNDNQFGFKKGLGCSHAIYTVKTLLIGFLGGNTANLCSIDLSKAIDKVNHHALFIKLMKKHIPVILLELLEFWLTNSWSCINNGLTYFAIFKNLLWCPPRLCSLTISFRSVFRRLG